MKMEHKVCSPIMLVTKRVKQDWTFRCNVNRCFDEKHWVKWLDWKFRIWYIHFCCYVIALGHINKDQNSEWKEEIIKLIEKELLISNLINLTLGFSENVLMTVVRK